MLDINLIFNNIDKIIQKLSNKHFKLDIKKINTKENNRKKIQIFKENLQAKRNKYIKEITLLKLNKKNTENLNIIVNNLNKKINIFKLKLYSLKKEIYDYMISIPNIHEDDVPVGFNSNSNVEIKYVGKKRKFNFPIKDHLSIGKISNEIDLKSATQITGTKFVVLKGNIAKMHRALIQFMLDIHINNHNYKEYYLPYLINQDSLYGTGHLPKFKNDLFNIKKVNNQIYYLIPTGEVPLINILKNKIFKENELPIKMVTHTTCFRLEAGSYGKINKGLLRMHQFDKIELIQAVKPSKSKEALEEITKHAENILKLLKLPYRKILLCTGELGFSSCKTYDLEVWLPSQKTFCEVSSCSNTGDFQSRRIKAIYKNVNQHKKFLHMLNGSGLAISRTLAAIIENYQLKDGHIKIPEVLKTYMNGLSII
ncbi:MAG: serine--tRNA ligase [Enterobacterales bacterium]